MRWRVRMRRLFPYLVAAAGGFLLAYLLVFFFVFPTSLVPDDAKVPNVVGLLRDDAARRLRAAGFEAARGEEVFHAAAPTTTVLRQDPGPGGVEPKGTKVILDVSAGQRSASVPDVVGMTRPEAEAALTSAGFDVGEVVERGSNSPRGAVIGTSPAAATTLTIPAPVTLVVSSGPSAVTVPDLVGRPLAEARAMLEQVGLAAMPPTVDSLSAFPADVIVAQSPAAGSAVPNGSRVRVTVSGAPP
jgi:beta-lactam-binding protein with PASTA domain